MSFSWIEVPVTAAHGSGQNLTKSPINWFWGDRKCSDAYFGGLFWEFMVTFAGIALCGLVLRRAIKREDAVKS